MMRKLSEEECRAAIAAGDFPAALAESAISTALILTQSWCPQWTWMKTYLDGLATEPDIAILWVEYDQEPFYDDFLIFKENTYKNRQIPYVRYYHNGKLAHESNYIDRSGFLRFLQS